MRIKSLALLLIAALCFAARAQAAGDWAVINEVYRGSGDLTTGPEWVEIVLTADLTAAELNTLYVGDSTSSTDAKAGAYGFTGMEGIAASFPKGTLIVVGGSASSPPADASYDPANGDWNITLKAGGSYLTTIADGDIGSKDAVWVDTSPTGSTISAQGHVVYWVDPDPTGGLLTGANAVRVGSVGNDTAASLTGSDPVDPAGWSVGGAGVPGAANGGDNTIWVEAQQDELGGADPLPNLVISAVYGGGGGTGAPYDQDYVEVFNPSSESASLSGLSVQVLQGMTWQVTPLPALTLPAGGYALLGMASGPTGDPLPTPDASGTTDLAAGAGSVALAPDTTPLTDTANAIDLVEYTGGSNSSALVRINGGCTDTDDFDADFIVLTPAPRSSASPVNLCSPDPAPVLGVSIAESADPATSGEPLTYDVTLSNTGTGDALDVTLTFSLSGDLAGGSYVAPPAGCSGLLPGPLTCELALLERGTQQTFSFTLEPGSAGIIDAAANFEGEAASESTTVELGLAGCGDPATAVHDVQAADPSPLAGQVVTLEGVVVGDYQSADELGGFYLQEEAADWDLSALTSEGIFVFSTEDVAVGDVVRVLGTVDEVDSETRLTSVTGLTICGSLTPTPTAVSLPLGAPEAYEGMLVTVEGTLATTDLDALGSAGQVGLSVDAPLVHPNQSEEAAGEVALIIDDGSTLAYPASLPFLPDPATDTLRRGDTLNDPTGVLSGAGGPRLIVQAPFTVGNPRPAAPVLEAPIIVMSLNVEGPLNADRLTKLGAQLAAPAAPLIALQNAADVAGITAALTAVTGIEYGSVSAEGLAFLYDPAGAMPQGTPTELDGALVQAFTIEGRTLTVANVALTGGAAQAATLAGALPTDALLLGALDAFRLEAPVTALTDAGFTDLIALRVGPEAYTAVLDGKHGTLDYVMAGPALDLAVQEVAVWHANADEPPLFDPAIPENPAAYLGAHPYRAASHDPILVGVALGPAPDAPPTDLTAERVPGGVRLTWVDNASDETAYRVEVLNQGNWTIAIDDLPPDTTTVIDGDPACDTALGYRVVALRAGVPSAPSNVAELPALPCSEGLLGNGSFEFEGIWEERISGGGLDGRLRLPTRAVDGEYVYVLEANRALEGVIQRIPIEEGLAEQTITLDGFMGYWRVRGGNTAIRLTLFSGEEVVIREMCLFAVSGSSGAVPISCGITAPAPFDEVLVEIGWRGAQAGRWGFDALSLTIE